MKSYKSLLLCSALALSVSAFGADALAEGNLEVVVDKDKDIDVNLTITKNKDIDIDVTLNETLDGAAEVDSVINQEIFRSSVSRSNKDNPSAGDGSTFNNGDGIRLDALIDDSYNNNQGVVQVNQDVGYMSNQGNVAAVAVVNTDNTFTAFADAEESAEQRTEGNSVTYEGGLGVADSSNPTTAITDPDRSAVIQNSLNANKGIVHVNQNAGAMNNQLNDVGLAVADESAVVALAEADLGQFNSFNSVDETDTVKQDVITNSINNNQAIVNVNQSTGNMNNQGTVISFAGLAQID